MFAVAAFVISVVLPAAPSVEAGDAPIASLIGSWSWDARPGMSSTLPGEAQLRDELHEATFVGSPASGAVVVQVAPHDEIRCQGPSSDLTNWTGVVLSGDVVTSHGRCDLDAPKYRYPVPQTLLLRFVGDLSEHSCDAIVSPSWLPLGLGAQEVERDELWCDHAIWGNIQGTSGFGLFAAHGFGSQAPADAPEPLRTNGAWTSTWEWNETLMPSVPHLVTSVHARFELVRSDTILLGHIELYFDDLGFTAHCMLGPEPESTWAVVSNMTGLWLGAGECRASLVEGSPSVLRVDGLWRVTPDPCVVDTNGVCQDVVPFSGRLAGHATVVGGIL